MYLPLWMVIGFVAFVVALVALRWEFMDLFFDRVGCPTVDDVWPQAGVAEPEPAGSDGERR